MKTLIAVLIILSFIQAAIIPINLVLIVLICRSYLKADKANLYLAFGFGLLDAHLNLTALGLSPLVYLLMIQITQSLSKSPLTGNSFLIIPISFVLFFAKDQLTFFFTAQIPSPISKALIESLLSLPVLYLLRLWEERFIVRKEIKLKI